MIRIAGMRALSGALLFALLGAPDAARAIGDGRTDRAAANFLAQAEQPFALTDEEIYLAFHQAIAAASFCAGREFGREDHDMMSDFIDVQIRWRLGAATRLGLVETAKASMWRRAAAGACDTAEVGAALRLFRERLQPTLAARWRGPGGDSAGVVGAPSERQTPGRENSRQTPQLATPPWQRHAPGDYAEQAGGERGPPDPVTAIVDEAVDDEVAFRPQ